MLRKLQMIFAMLAILSLAISGCVAPQGAAPAAAPAAGDAAAAPATGGDAASSTDLTRPSVLADANVRKAIAHCIDRDALISAVYTYVPDDVKAGLRMDSFLPKTHWAYKGPYTDYAFSVENGSALLESAGWKLEEGAAYRTNAAGDRLVLSLTTTNSAFRKTWGAVVEQQLAACGIALIGNYIPASIWFGDGGLLNRRDFELGAFAWVGQAEPSGRTLYDCKQIPMPANNWEGQNNMGWCNEEASKAIVLANNTLDRETRITAYDTVQKNFADDMVSLPLFQRAEAEAWSKNLEGLKVDPTEYGTASVADWKLTDGGDTIVIGFSQEPASMWGLVESAAVAVQANQIGGGLFRTQYSYDFQPVFQDGLSTIESGLAKNETVKVKAGDTVYSEEGSPIVLEKGSKIIVNGESVEYDGVSEVEMPQLTVTYKFKPYTWNDGTAGSIEDFKLALKIDCDRLSGATEFTSCEQFGTETNIDGNVTFSDNGLEYTVKYWPGVQNPTYFLPAIGTYPSHLVTSDGRKLAEIPAPEWATLPEIAEKPLSFGPFFLSDWQKGQSMTFERNPHYAAGTGVEKITIVFVQDTTQLIAQFLSGDLDYVEKATLAGGSEVQLVSDAAKEGKVNFEIISSPTWEHIDMNMFIKEK